MTDEQPDSSHSTTAGEPVQGGSLNAVADDLFAIDQYETLSVANGVLLIGKTTGSRLTVMPEVELVLQHCSVFRTLAEHAQHLVTLFPQLGGNVEDAQRVLDMVQAGGLMLSASAICRQVNALPAAASEPAPAHCFIITCDRPDAVQRLLDSILQHGQLSPGQSFDLVDDSREPANAETNRSLVERFNSSSIASARYIGAAEQDRLLRGLVEALPEAASGARFLLERERWAGFKTYGRARNLCLLLGAEERCVVLDDDVLCASLGSPQPAGGVRFADGGIEAEFYSTAEEWRERTTLQRHDPIAGHAQCLGLQLPQALAELGIAELQPAHMAGASASLFQHLTADTSVLVTQSGTLGDPGTGDSNAWLVRLGLPSIQRMLAAPGGLRNALTTRQCWLGQRAPTFSKVAVMSQVTGLDNRQVLPPYFPILRGEDQLFGTLLDFLHPDSTVLEYAWSVPHLPLEARSGNPQGDSVVPRGGLQLLGVFLSRCRPQDPAVGFNTRLALLVNRLHELSEYTTAAMTTELANEVARAQALTLQTLRDRLADSGNLDAEWQQLLQRNAREAGQALQSAPSLDELPGLPAGISAEEVAAKVRTYAAEFADALRAWPQLRITARTLSAGLASR